MNRGVNDSLGEFELPVLYKYSGLFVIVGIILLYWSQALYFVAGNTARLGSLGLGLIAIVAAAVLRGGWRTMRHFPFVLFTGAYFCILALLTKIQWHMIWYDSTQQIFCVVSLVMFWAGYILAREKRQNFLSANQWQLVCMAVLAIVALLAFTRFMKAISFHGSERGFGQTMLNPVGVAYANMCLGLTFITLGMLSSQIWRKALFLGAGALAFFIVLSSASRGAVIWGLLALAFFIYLNRNRKYLSFKNVFFVLIAMSLLAPVFVYIYKSNYAIAERIDILWERFEVMYYSLMGGRHDSSLLARQSIWSNYMNNIDQWILLGEKGYDIYPHNQWLEIGVRFGLLGIPMFFMSIYTLWRLIWDSVRGKQHPDLEFSLIVTLFVYSYLQSMTSLSLQVNRALWLGFGYLLGHFVVQYHRRARHQ